MGFEHGGFESQGGKSGPTRDTHKYSGAYYREQKERRDREKLESLREKYSKEFSCRPLHVKSVVPEKYTEKMKEDDQQYIIEWKEYNLGRVQWLQEELTGQYNQRLDAVKGVEERRDLSSWYFAEKGRLFEEQMEILHQWALWHREILAVNFENIRRKYSDEASGGERGQNHDKQGGSSSGQSSGGSKQKPGSSGETKRPEDKPEKTVEQVALKELGITFDEYNIIINLSSRLSEAQVILLAEKIFGVSDGKNGAEVKKAYRKCASMWHPDNSEVSKKDMNMVKFQIVNNFYNRHYKVAFDN